MTRAGITLPTLRPRLPDADAIGPFLQEIDRRRWYSNFGPLNERFERELAGHFEAPPGSVVTVSSATAGLSLALRAASAETGGLCIMPAWTFAATPVAAVNAGLQPYFLDVDPQSWQLTVDTVHRALGKVRQRISAVVVVAPFGASVETAAWAEFYKQTGIPVIIDAAAGFDTARSHPEIVSVISLHATKVIGVGEGGFILCGNKERAEQLRRMSNFGLDASRRSIYPGANAKLSEYAAAVGLAAFRRWPQIRAGFLRKAALYRSELIKSEEDGDIFLRNDTHASATFNVVLRRHKADDLIARMSEGGMEARRWWSEGCHRHPAFADSKRDDLSVTDRLVETVVALPFWIDMRRAQMSAVATRLRDYFRLRPEDALKLG